MTREDRDLAGLIVPGSDHLTTYNVYAEAFTKCGYLGEVYGLPRQMFDESIERWAEGRGVLVKSLEDAALAMASIYRSVGCRCRRRCRGRRRRLSAAGLSCWRRLCRSRW
jgi:ATP-dependent helicase HrpA